MENNNREYTNGEITVYWKPSLCIHSTVCFNELPKVFIPSRRPWINLKAASNAHIIETVGHCPTEALSYKYNKDLEKEHDNYHPASVEITIIKNGPAIIKGKVKVKTPDGNIIDECDRINLCRCGRSAKMPYCDGSHKNSGFES